MCCLWSQLYAQPCPINLSLHPHWLLTANPQSCRKSFFLNTYLSPILTGSDPIWFQKANRRQPAAILKTPVRLSLIHTCTCWTYFKFNECVKNAFKKTKKANHLPFIHHMLNFLFVPLFFSSFLLFSSCQRASKMASCPRQESRVIPELSFFFSPSKFKLTFILSLNK